MTGKRLTERRKNSINVCYLIDVAPEKFRGGGQAHLANIIREVNFQFSIFNFQLFAAQEASMLIRFLWSVWVIPQTVFYHIFIERFDLIHAHSIPAMTAGKILSVILKIPIMVTVHGYNEKRWMEKFVLTKVRYDKQITVARNFLEYPNVNQPVYIPNGVDVALFAPSSKFQVPSSKSKKVLFVGRKNDPVKGFAVLEKAMEMVKKEIPNVKLLVTDGSYSQDEVIKAYHKADLFVLPSLSEGFPLTLLEAWAAKLPVIATKVGELPCLIKDGINGYLVEPGSAPELASTIVTALRNRNLAKLGENGYNMARKFNWELVARKTIKIYKSLLSTH